MKYFIALICLALFPFAAISEDSENNSTLLFEVERAKVLKRVPPTYPEKSSRRSQEGWVRFTYVITEDGNVIDPVITDSSGEKGFERSALRSIKKWKFEPATQDGKPIQQCDMEVQFDFKLDSASKGVRRQFNRLYQQATDAIRADDLITARDIVDKIKNKKIWNMYENAWYWMINSRVASLEGNAKAELSSLYRSVQGVESPVYLGNDNYIYNLHRIFILELQKQKYANASDTFLLLKEQEGSEKYIPKLQTYYDRVSALLNSDEPLILELTIDDRGVKEHKLYRNSFAIGDIKGEIDMLDIRCQNKRTKFTAAVDTFWSIPEKWGKCSVLFEGDEETTFSVFEVVDVKET